MMTIESLKKYGADVETGLARCMGQEAFYLRFVRMMLDDKNFSQLSKAVEQGDPKAAFEAAHALKGVAGNLSLTPIFEPVSELTDVLRDRTDMPETAEWMDRIRKAMEDLRARDA